MVRRIGFGVVGLGWFGEKHTQVLTDLPFVEVVAVCSRTEARAREIAQRYGVPRWYTRWDDLVKDEGVEAVSVVTHVQDHRAPVVAAAEAGKHVICEKPIANTLADADAMIAATKRAGVHFMVGHILRFEPRYAQAKALIDEGRVGQVVSIYARRNIPRGIAASHLQKLSPILGDAIHDTDLMLWYLGERVREVYATWVSTTDAPNPDVTWSLYNFESQAKGVAESVWYLPNNTPFSIDARMEILGTEGGLYIDCANSGLGVNDANGWKLLDTMHWPVIHGGIVGALKEELAYFARCVLEDRSPEIVTPAEARAALEVVLAAEESARKGAPVRLG